MFVAMGRAFRLLTVFPFGHDSETAVDPARVAGWFALTGATIGSVAWLAVEVFSRLAPLARWGALPAIAALIGVALCTRLMHWDGLADVADGWWGGYTPERRREIASDSATGAFGTSAIAIGVVLEFVLLSGVIGSGLAFVLPAIFMLSRLAATSASWFGTPAKKEGLGKSSIGLPGAGAVVALLVNLLGVLGATFYLSALPLSAAWVFLAAGVVAIVWPYVIAPRFGGMTGDVMGASILLSELTGLFFVYLYGVIS